MEVQIIDYQNEREKINAHMALTLKMVKGTNIQYL